MLHGSLEGEFASFVERYLNPVSVSGKEVMCVCIFHDDHNASMQFNLEKGLFNCFSCQVGGSYRKIEKKLGIAHSEIGVSLDVILRKLNELKHGAGRDKGMRVIPETELNKFTMPTDYWAKRGLWESTVSAFDLGYDIVNDAVTIPVRNMDGALLGITRRYLDPDADTRYKYPAGFKKGEHLFGSWLVANDPSALSVTLTEGAIDAMQLWQWGVPAMAIYGSSVTLEQIRQLKRLGLSEVVLFFDNDRAGEDLVRRCRGWKNTGTDRWQRVADLDLRRHFNVKTVRWGGISKRVAKDVNDLDLLQARNMLAKAVRLP